MYACFGSRGAFRCEDDPLILVGVGGIRLRDHLAVEGTDYLLQITHEGVNEMWVLAFVAEEALLCVSFDEEFEKCQHTFVQARLLWLEQDHVGEGKEIGVRLHGVGVQLLFSSDEQLLCLDLPVVVTFIVQVIQMACRLGLH